MTDPKNILEAIDGALDEDAPAAEPDYDIVPELEVENEIETDTVDQPDPPDEPVSDEKPEADAQDEEEPPADRDEEGGVTDEEESDEQDEEDDSGEKDDGSEDPKSEDEGEEEESEEDELPKNTPERTRKRFESLKEKFHEIEGKYQKERDLNEGWLAQVRDTGAAPEQIGVAFQYLKALNSGTREGLEKAYEFMQGELAVLGKALGREAPGFDPLDDYSDIKQEFENGEISRERAIELAQARKARNLESAQRELQGQKQSEHQAIEEGMKSLSALGQELSKDAQWKAKQSMLTPLVKTIVKTVKDPSKWAEAVRDAYAGIPDLPAPAAPDPVAVPKAPNPIRPGQGPSAGTGVSKKPGNIMEALDQALGL